MERIAWKSLLFTILGIIATWLVASLAYGAASLPTPGGSSDTWGTDLNTWLLVEHAADGTHDGFSSLDYIAFSNGQIIDGNDNGQFNFTEASETWQWVFTSNTVTFGTDTGIDTIDVNSFDLTNIDVLGFNNGLQMTQNVDNRIEWTENSETLAWIFNSNEIQLGTDSGITGIDCNQFDLHSIDDLTLDTGGLFTIGSTQWNSGDSIDGTKVANADLGEVTVTGGSWTIDDGVAVTNWALTTPSVVTSLTMGDDVWIGQSDNNLIFDDTSNYIYTTTSKLGVGIAAPEWPIHSYSPSGANPLIYAENNSAGAAIRLETNADDFARVEYYTNGNLNWASGPGQSVAEVFEIRDLTNNVTVAHWAGSSGNMTALGDILLADDNYIGQTDNKATFDDTGNTVTFANTALTQVNTGGLSKISLGDAANGGYCDVVWDSNYSGAGARSWKIEALNTSIYLYDSTRGGFCWSVDTTGRITASEGIEVPDGKTIGATAGLRLTFDDTADELELAGSSNLCIGTTTKGSGAPVYSIIFGDGNEPTTMASNTVALWAEDVTGSHELRVKDEGGTVTTLSANVNGYPDEIAASERWPYVTVRENAYAGTRTYVALNRMAELVQELARAEGLLDPNECIIVHEDIPKRDWDADEQAIYDIAEQRRLDAMSEMSRLALKIETYQEMLADLDPNVADPNMVTDLERKVTKHQQELDSITVPDKHEKRPKPKWIK